jgi:AbrB family looped-hinge helix DNA binding protein
MPSNVTSKGQVTIPKSIRDHFGIEPGTPIEMKIAADGQIVLTKAEAATTPPANRFAGLRGRASSGMTTEEIMALFRGGDDD